MTRNERTGLRRKILDTTRNMLIREGVSRLSMRKIAARIGCKAPSIYYHFDGKAALIRALVEEGHQKLYEAMRAAVAGQDDPVRGLEAYMRGYVGFALENPEYYEIMFMSTHEASGYDAIESFRLARRSRRLAVETFEAAHRLGLVEETDFDEATSAIGIMLHGYVTLAIHHESAPPFDRERMLTVIVERVFRAYGVSLVGSR